MQTARAHLFPQLPRAHTQIGEIPTPWPCFVVAVRTDVLEKHGGKVKDLLGVLAKVCSEFKAAADSVAYIAAEYKLKVCACVAVAAALLVAVLVDGMYCIHAP